MITPTLRHAFRLAALVALLAIAAPARAAELEPPPIPDTPAGDAFRWVLEQSAAPDKSTIQERLGDTINNAKAPTPDRLFSDFNKLKRDTGGGFDVIRLVEVDQFELDALLRAKNNESWWVVTLSVVTQPPHVQLREFDFSALVSRPGTGIHDWGDLNWRLSTFPLPPRFSLHVEQTRSGDRGFKPHVSLRDDRRAAVGPAASVFPMVRLAELAAENPGLLDDTVELVPERRSVVSPVLGEKPDGERVALKELLGAARAGDLTALDHLIGYLGREDVERVAARFQSREDEQTPPNTPFLTSAEFFKLKLLDEDHEAYRAFVSAESPEAKREALAMLEGEPLPSIEDAEAVTEPSRVREVEWRASSRELTLALRALEAAMDADETGAVREALNEIGPDNRQMGVWTFVFVITGGEPGVYAEAFLLERLDGERFRFAIAAENPSEEIDFRFLSQIPRRVITLLALEP